MSMLILKDSVNGIHWFLQFGVVVFLFHYMSLTQGFVKCMRNRVWAGVGDHAAFGGHDARVTCTSQRQATLAGMIRRR